MEALQAERGGRIKCVRSGKGGRNNPRAVGEGNGDICLWEHSREGMDEEKPQGVYLGCVLLIRRLWEKYYREKGDFMKIKAKCGCFSQFPLPYKTAVTWSALHWTFILSIRFLWR